MVTFAFWLLAVLGAGSLALGIFPAYFGERFVETATVFRIMGMLFFFAAFVIRRQGNAGAPADRD